MFLFFGHFQENMIPLLVLFLSALRDGLWVYFLFLVAQAPPSSGSAHLSPSPSPPFSSSFLFLLLNLFSNCPSAFFPCLSGSLTLDASGGSIISQTRSEGLFHFFPTHLCSKLWDGVHLREFLSSSFFVWHKYQLVPIKRAAGQVIFLGRKEGKEECFSCW